MNLKNFIIKINEISQLKFRRNVDCESKSDDETEESSPAPFSSTTETSSEEEENDKKSGDKKDPKTLEEVLAAIKEAGKYFSQIEIFHLKFIWDEVCSMVKLAGLLFSCQFLQQFD